MKTVGSNLPVTMRYNIIVINMAIIDIPKHPPKQPTANILVSLLMEYLMKSSRVEITLITIDILKQQEFLDD
ncbi:MAG: hypothetical protein NZ735_04420 [Candidatus Marinimicrobia bacterium]|jgi:hypothetical protein|nr:hypothetical protein [Candidatus Neomarinimicrobiota bacterium]